MQRWLIHKPLEDLVLLAFEQNLIERYRKEKHHLLVQIEGVRLKLPHEQARQLLCEMLRASGTYHGVA